MAAAFQKEAEHCMALRERCRHFTSSGFGREEVRKCETNQHQV